MKSRIMLIQKYITNSTNQTAIIFPHPKYLLSKLQIPVIMHH